MELFAPLDPEKVDELEGYLNLPQSEIARIQKDYQSPTQRKEAYLDLYVHQHPCPTWGRVAGVLRREVHLPQQADLVMKIYVKGTQDTLCSETVVCASIINTAYVAIGSPVCYFTYPYISWCDHYLMYQNNVVCVEDGKFSTNFTFS